VSQSKKAIYVCPLSLVEMAIDAVGAEHLVTLINNETMIDTPPRIVPEKHLRLAMNDIIEPIPGMVHPNEDHVARLIEFTDAWESDAPMIIHCWAGISRSTAAAYVALCRLNPDVNEMTIAAELRSASSSAYPNRRIVSLADKALGRNGRMVEAVEAIGRGELTFEGELFRLPVRFEG
jgi:predicted protein tyrosine phosphatase